MKMQIVAGGAFTTSFHVARPDCSEATNLRLLNQANTMANAVATAARVKLDQSYGPGIQNRTLFAKKSASKLRIKKDHFILFSALSSTGESQL